MDKINKKRMEFLMFIYHIIYKEVKNMYRTVKTLFRASKKDIDRLFECNRISAQIWNDCLTIAKSYAQKNNGKWINQTELQKQTKGKYPIHSQSIQAVCHKYLNARDSAKKAKQKGLDNNIRINRKNISTRNGQTTDLSFTQMGSLN